MFLLLFSPSTVTLLHRKHGLSTHARQSLDSFRLGAFLLGNTRLRSPITCHRKHGLFTHARQSFDYFRFYSVTFGSVRRSHASSLPLSSLCGSFCAILSAPLCWLGFWDLLWSQSEGYRTTGETVKGCACSKGNGSWQHGLVCQWPTKWLIPNTEIKSVNYARGREREP